MQILLFYFILSYIILYYIILFIILKNKLHHKVKIKFSIFHEIIFFKYKL